MPADGRGADRGGASWRTSAGRAHGAAVDDHHADGHFTRADQTRGRRGTAAARRRRPWRPGRRREWSSRPHPNLRRSTSRIRCAKYEPGGTNCRGSIGAVQVHAGAARPGSAQQRRRPGRSCPRFRRRAIWSGPGRRRCCLVSVLEPEIWVRRPKSCDEPALSSIVGRILLVRPAQVSTTRVVARVRPESKTS